MKTKKKIEKPFKVFETHEDLFAHDLMVRERLYGEIRDFMSERNWKEIRIPQGAYDDINDLAERLEYHLNDQTMTSNEIMDPLHYTEKVITQLLRKAYNEVLEKLDQLENDLAEELTGVLCLKED